MRLFALLSLVLIACSGAESNSGVAPTVTPDPNETSGTDETPPEPEPETGNLVVGTDECVSDADCVPSECCHAAACVAVANSPSCGDAICTQECRFGTLDCGGGCLCHEGHCAGRLSEPPAAIREAVENDSTETTVQ